MPIQISIQRPDGTTDNVENRSDSELGLADPLEQKFEQEKGATSAKTQTEPFRENVHFQTYEELVSSIKKSARPEGRMGFNGRVGRPTLDPTEGICRDEGADEEEQTTSRIYVGMDPHEFVKEDEKRYNLYMANKDL